MLNCESFRTVVRIFYTFCQPIRHPAAVRTRHNRHNTLISQCFFSLLIAFCNQRARVSRFYTLLTSCAPRGSLSPRKKHKNLRNQCVRESRWLRAQPLLLKLAFTLPQTISAG